LQRANVPIPNMVFARTSCRIPSNAGRETIIPVRLVIDPEDQNIFLAEPVFSKSGLITLLSQSDGCIRISRDREGLEMHSPVTVYRF
jgi:molybdopterin molybdotransferase